MNDHKCVLWVSTFQGEDCLPHVEHWEYSDAIDDDEHDNDRQGDHQLILPGAVHGSRVEVDDDECEYCHEESESNYSDVDLANLLLLLVDDCIKSLENVGQSTVGPCAHICAIVYIFIVMSFDFILKAGVFQACCLVFMVLVLLSVLEEPL